MVGGEIISEPSASSAPGDFEELFRQHFDRCARLAFLLTGDAGAAEDLAQEAFSRVQPVFGQLDIPAAYLRTVLVNLCRRHRGQQARRRLLGERLLEPASVSAEARELLDVIDRLPRRQQVVIVLRYYEDLSEAQIAAVLGCRPGTVKSLAARALARLRKEPDT